MNSSILARLHHRVETIACLIPLIWAVSAYAATDRDEPDPWPQVDVPAQSDYYEAKQLLAKHKWQEAAIVLRSVLKKNVDFSPASVELARALAYSGRREEALGVLSQALNRERGSRRNALIRRTRVLSRIFFNNKTFQVYQDGLNFLFAKKYRLARERFDKALEQEPDNIEVLTRLGQCLILDNDNDSAAERLRIAKRLNPFEPETRLWLGRAMHQRGELNEAVDELRIAYNDLEGSELAPLWLAEALSSLGQRAQAIQVLDDDTKIQPFHVAGLIALARFRSLQSRQDRDGLMAAKKDLQIALSRLPKYRSAEAPPSEGELGLDLGRPEPELKSEIEKLLHDVEGRLAAITASLEE